jgi:hypothetical protein
VSDDIRDPSERPRDAESSDASPELSDADARALDRLARLAREAEPPKLSAGETDALVLAVLARRKEPVRVDSMPPSLRDEPLTPAERELARPDPLETASEAASARSESSSGPSSAVSSETSSVRGTRDELPRDEGTGDELAARRAERGARATGRGRWTWAAAAALALGAIGGSLGGFAIGRVELARVDIEAPSRVTLPTGDTLVATHGAELAFAESSDVARRVEVRSGTVLFDVAPLAAGERFVVNARGVRAEVRGTVFSVGADARVRVYEGAVSVEEGGASVLVTAGRMWADGAVRARDEGPLEAHGLDAAARRTTLASREVGTSGAVSNDALALRDGTNVAATGDVGLGVRDEASDVALGANDPSDANANANANDADDTNANDTSTNANANDANEPDDTIANANDTNDDVGAAVGGDVLRASATERRAVDSTGRAPTDASRPRASSPSRGASDDAPITPERLAQWIAGGDAERALAEARRRGWRLSEADALRALRRGEEALTIYERLASRDGYAAFTGARVAQELGDRRRALALLERAPASAFDERALGLRVRLLVEGGRRAEALPLAASYVERFPNGSLAEWMRALPDAE